MAALTIQRIEPSSQGAGIKRLFLGHERPEFPGWFERAYPVAVRDGATSFVSLDESGQVVIHMAAFRASFWLGEGRVDGALLCNLMAHRDHRGFFPVVAVIKRAVRDLRADGAEFIYTNPINKGSVAVMKAGGLPQIGSQNRFLLPLGHRRMLVDLALAARLGARRFLWPRLTAHEVPAAQAAEWTVRTRTRVSRVTSARHPQLYFMRLGPLEGERFIGIRLTDAVDGEVGAALAHRESDDPTEWDLVTLRCLRIEHVPGAVAAVGQLMRRHGARRLSLSALQSTPYAAALVRGGSIQRHEPWAIVGAGYTDAGKSVIAGMAESDLEKIDVD